MPTVDGHSQIIHAWQRQMALRCWLLAIVCLAIPGCRGCNSDLPVAERDLEKQGKKAEKPKPDFDALKFAVVPNDKKGPARFIKPGHWTSVTYEARANNFDFSGRLTTQPVDGTNSPITLPGTPFYLSTTRSAVLPKGQKKLLETTLFVPQGFSQSQFLTRLVDRRGAEVRTEPDPVVHLAAYQYYLVALSADDQRYAFLKVIDSVRPPYDDITVEDLDYHYRVILPKVADYAPLPSQALHWTSIAYVVWDDIHPDVLKAEQRQAMLDWLHWGGHLIISGPRTLDALRGSFLEPYLPAAGEGNVPLDAGAIKAFNDTLVGTSAREPREIKQAKPWSGVKLKLTDGSTFSPNVGELLAERPVGRGMIVVSAFRLAEPDLVKWKGYDGFLNAYLLRRTPREFREGPAGQLQVAWKGGESRTDPKLTSHLRYFTRDTDAVPDGAEGATTLLDSTPVRDRLQPDLAVQRFPGAVPSYPGQFGDPSFAQFDLTSEQQKSGVAGWSDNNIVAQHARQSLRDAAGITVPRREFVMWIVGAYLLVVVPLNWVLFKVIGRVEWAWAAVPLIAVGCAMVVIKLARLDIGFARAATEVAVVETQPGYGRAHLTRFTALYTSLSTSYDMRFAEPSAVALPLSSGAAILTGQGTSTVSLDQAAQIGLAGFPVASNSTGLVHSEQMFDLGGGLSLSDTIPSALQVTNGTKLPIRGAAVLRRASDGSRSMEAAWIGDLGAGEKREFHLQPLGEAGLLEQRAQSAISAEKSGVGGLAMKPLFELAENSAAMEPSEIRLVGWSDQQLAGVEVEPAASQARHAVLIVGHLGYAARPPQLDANSRADLPNARSREVREEDFSDEEL